MAVREARQKAGAIASAAGLRIRNIDRILEGGVSVRVREMRVAQAVPGSTPVEPGNVVVTAQITVVLNRATSCRISSAVAGVSGKMSL